VKSEAETEQMDSGAKMRTLPVKKTDSEDSN